MVRICFMSLQVKSGICGIITEVVTLLFSVKWNTPRPAQRDILSYFKNELHKFCTNGKLCTEALCSLCLLVSLLFTGMEFPISNIIKSIQRELYCVAFGLKQERISSSNLPKLIYIRQNGFRHIPFITAHGGQI